MKSHFINRSLIISITFILIQLPVVSHAIDCSHLGSAGNTEVNDTTSCVATSSNYWTTGNLNVTSLGEISTNSGNGLTVNTGLSVGTLTNSGSIYTQDTGSRSAIVSNGTMVGLINNSSGIIGGTTWGSGGRYGINFYASASLTSLINFGSISGYYYGIVLNAANTIQTLTNAGSGSIYGNFSNIGIFNGSGVVPIVTLNNAQGAGNTNGALVYAYDPLPTRYNIIVNGANNYGQLSLIYASGSLTTAFNIYGNTGTTLVTDVSASVLTATRYLNVLQGFSSLSGVTGTTGTYGSYTYSLVANATLANSWDLLVTGGSGGGGSGGGGGGGSSSTISNIVPNGSFNLSSIGVTANPVFDGGTLTLAPGNSSSQAFTVNTLGGTIQSPITGTATLSGQISGVGGMTFTGTGTTILSGTNTYTGGTIVSSGTLSLEGTSATGTGDVLVDTAGTLMGTGTINGKLTVAGILKPGNSPGFLATNSSVTMNNGSTYQQDIAGTAQASQVMPIGATGYYSYLNVTGGQFIINSGSTLTPRLSNLFAANEAGYGSTPYTPVLGDRFRIVTASGGISGKFSTVTQPAELTAGTQFLPFYNMAGSNSLDLALIPTSYNKTIASLSGNKNAQSVGGALDKMVIAAQSG